MNKVLAWAKGNWLILLMCVLILVGPIVGYIFASRLNNNIKTTRETEAKADFDKLSRAEVTYTVGPILPGEQAIEVRRVPHPELTEYFKALRERRAAQVQVVVEKALERNKAGHDPLVEGLLPAPPERDSQLLRLEMQRRLVGTVNDPSVLELLLEEINAGGPPDANEVAALLTEYQTGEIEKHEAEFGTRELNDENRKTLNEDLVKRRIGEYQRRAGEISVYADLSVMPQSFPRSEGGEPPSIVRCFEWQWDYWLVQDLLKAVALANTGDDGELLDVPDAPVKRIVTMETSPLPGVWEESYEIKRNLTRGELVATDPVFSVTGRVSHDQNELYDVRPATLSLIVASNRLPEVIEAIGDTNFMGVTDLDVVEIDPWEHLRLGYYYGNQHVVQVDLTVETIWLREWVVPYMPEQIRPLMSVEEEGA